MNGATCPAWMPAKVSVNARASVTAGFANDVDAVNQYAAAMYAATANGVALDRLRVHDSTTRTRPNVATASLSQRPALALAFAECCTSGRSNMACAHATPPSAPMNCAAA